MNRVQANIKKKRMPMYNSGSGDPVTYKIIQPYPDSGNLNYKAVLQNFFEQHPEYAKEPIYSTV